MKLKKLTKPLLIGLLVLIIITQPLLTVAYPGMSGGPVLDEQGKLIGIHGESQDIYGGAGLEPTPINREEYGIPIKTYQTWASQLSQRTQKSALEYLTKGIARGQSGDYRGAIDDLQKSADLYQKQRKEDFYRNALNRIREIKRKP